MCVYDFNESYVYLLRYYVSNDSTRIMISVGEIMRHIIILNSVNCVYML